MKRLNVTMIVPGLMLSAAVLYGARPFSVDDAGTVAPGAYELEAGSDYWEEIGTLCVGFKHGLTEKMDLGVGLGYNLNPNGSIDRFEPLELCFKYNFIADFLSASLATGFQERSYSVNGILTRCLGDLELDGNFGFSAAENTVTYGCALIYGLTDRWNMGLEATGDKDGPASLLAGTNYSVFEPVRFDIGFASDFDFDAKSVTAGIHGEF